MKKHLYLLLIGCILGSFGAIAQNTNVWVISTLHKHHPAYNYDSLFNYIENLQGDVLAVEIRSEDIDSTVTFLKSMYPFEMYEALNRNKNLKRYGIDWLGHELENRSIPEGYWQNSSLRKLQIELSKDSLVMAQLGTLKPFIEKKVELIKKANISQMNNGEYDSLNEDYYALYRSITENTPYAYLGEFYALRDKKIADNCVKIIKENSGKRIVILVGADHRSFLVKSLQMEFGNTINLKSI